MGSRRSKRLNKGDDGADDEDDLNKTIIPSTQNPHMDDDATGTQLIVLDDTDKLPGQDKLNQTKSMQSAIKKAPSKQSSMMKRPSNKPPTKKPSSTKSSSKKSSSKKTSVKYDVHDVKRLEVEMMYMKRRHELAMQQLELEEQLELAKIADESDHSDSDDSQINDDNEKDVHEEYLTSFRNTKMWLDRMKEDNKMDDKVNDAGPSCEKKVRELDLFSCDQKRKSAEPVRDVDFRDFIARQSIPSDLPVFTGDPLDWPIFISEFKSTTQICNFSDHENLIRLRKSLSGNAKESVQSLLVLPGNVNKIIDYLETRFGDPVQIVRHSIDKIKNSPSVRDDKPDTFMKFFDSLTNLIHTLQSLNQNDHIRNPILFEEILNKFSISKRISFLKYYDGLSSTDPKIIVLQKWLMKEVKAVNQLMFSTPRDDDKNKNKGRQKETTLTTTSSTTTPTPTSTNSSTTTNKPNSVECSFCKSTAHRVYLCDEFTKLTVDERWSFVTKNKLCISCLGRFHSSRNCRRRQNCNIDECSKPHNKLLHKKDNNGNNKPKNDSVPQSDDVIDKNCNINDVTKGRVLLKIVPITIDGPNRSVSTYALLDDASTVSLVDQDFAKEIGLDGPSKPLRIQWTNNQVKEQDDSKIVSMSIRGNYDGAKSYVLRHVKTISGLCLPTQTVDVDFLQKSSPFLTKFKSLSFVNARPMLLIGQDNWPVIVNHKIVYRQWNGPVVSKTKLGWIIHGNTSSDTTNDSTHMTTDFVFNVYDVSSDLDDKDDLNILNDLVKSQWKLDLDNTTTKDIEMSKDDKRCVEIMNQTIKRIDDNKFESGLLWKSDDFQLPESRYNALSRLHHLENKMDKNPQYAKVYCDKIDDYVQKGYLKKLTTDEAEVVTDRTFYLPHFGVVNPNKPNKLRIVFDAAAKSNKFSLNDFLLTGPDLYNSLLTILMNFRRHSIAFVGDIQEMFLQIAVREDDRHAQRILWRDMTRDKPPDTYEIQVVFFGAKCSPCVSQEVKNKNALEFRHLHPKACDDIISKHYMDDYLGGADTVDDAIQLIEDVISVHRMAGFKMCSWISNSDAVLKRIQPELQPTKLPKKEIDDSKEERILGLWWDYEKDVFTYNFKFHKIDSAILNLTRRPTKRDVLKVVMSMFDPLGFLSNFMIVGKILLQSVWDCGIGWDEILPDEQFDMWKTWIAKLPNLTDFTIARQMTTLPVEKCDVQLHIFCDASKYAYASCAYLRFQFEDEIECSLVLAKSRVAPLKPTSIPRLELQSALLGARILKNLKENLDIVINSVFLWSDSEIVLSWIRSNSRRFKVYVGQRIAEIHDVTDIHDWRYVPSKLNIADDATKVKPIDFSPDSRWIKGPLFLYESIDKWPKKSFLNPDDNGDLGNNEYVNVTTEKLDFKLPDVTRFSKWSRYLRTTAWMKRFIHLIKNKRRRVDNVELQPEELSEAEILIYRKVQNDVFAEELNCLMNKKSIPNNSELRSLPLMIDNDNLIRLKGRLDNVTDEDFDYNSKNPIVLPPKHPITVLIIRHYHEKNNHIGHETIISNLRQIYWITGLRNAVKKVTYECQVCRNTKAHPQSPLMGQLPYCRVNPTTRPFEKTGVDLFGPYEVTVNRRHEKRYGVLFTCMVTRAIHLEIANDLSSNAFLHVWRQFGCRRGFPKELYSDNGTNFRKASKEIHEAQSNWPHDEITNQMTMANCKWIFNPPSAPHMGGAWERMIKSVKSHLSYLLKERYPKEFVLRTLFCEIENIVNSRPLTHLPLTSDDASPITPNDLLIGPTSASLQFAMTTDKDVTLLNMWRATQRLTDIFWNQWKKEYRQYILSSKKWTKDCAGMKVGDVVLVTDPNSIRNNWPKGIIEKTYPSKDGRVRIVDVKTVSGLFRRPVHRLVKLDVLK